MGMPVYQNAFSCKTGGTRYLLYTCPWVKKQRTTEVIHYCVVVHTAWKQRDFGGAVVIAANEIGYGVYLRNAIYNFLRVARAEQIAANYHLVRTFELGYFHNGFHSVDTAVNIGKNANFHRLSNCARLIGLRQRIV